MKKLIIYSFMSLIVLASCRKSDNIKVPEFTKVPLPLIKLGTGSSLTIPGINQDDFKATFSVSLYYPSATPPAKLDIVVMKNGDPKNVKVLQANVTTYPTTITITGAQFKTMFGAPIAGGDDFNIGANITTQEGVTYDAFPLVGAGYSANISSLAGSSVSLDFAALAPFVASAYGTIGVPTPYIVVADGWNDFKAGDIILVTVIDATHLSFKYAADAAQPIIITVDPVTNQTSVAKQVYGNYGAASGGDFSAESIASADNMVYPLKLTVGVKLHHTESGGGDFGSYTITLKKK